MSLYISACFLSVCLSVSQFVGLTAPVVSKLWSVSSA